MGRLLGVVETRANWRVYSASEEDSNSQLSCPVAPDLAIFPKHRATWNFGKLAEVFKHCFDLKKKKACSQWNTSVCRALFLGHACNLWFKGSRGCQGIFRILQQVIALLIVTPNHPSPPAFQKEMTSRMCH